MKKIRCPQCAVINLEKFVTFPYCAGCGALLPQAPAAGTPVTLWRRPLGPLLWVTAIGCAVGGLVAVSTSFNRTSPEPGHIIIYGQAPQSTPLHGLLTLRLTVDTIESPTARDKMLLDVKLRLTDQWLHQFRFVSLLPPPDAVTSRGSGHYYHYKSLARDTPLKLTLRALQPGAHRLKAVIYAQQQYPGNFRALIKVTPARKLRLKPRSLPLAHSKLNSN